MRERKFYAERVRRYTDKMERVLYDAYLKIEADGEARGQSNPRPEDVDIISWPQEWPDARCGFERPLKDVHRSEQTDVVLDNRVGTAYVYHAGHFARRVEKPTDAFWKAANERRLPGAVETDAWAALES